MSKENSKSGASNSTRRKFEHLTKESGFDGDVTNPSAIVGETETGVGGAGSGLDFLVPVPSSGSQTYAAFQNVMGQDTAIQGGEIPTEDQETNGEDHAHIDGSENLTVVTEGVVPVLEAVSANGQQEMVLASNQQNIAGEPQAQATDIDLTPGYLDAVRREHERKNAELKKVKKELAECKLNESQLKEEVDKLTKEIEELRKEKENLEQELHRKEEETKKTKEQQQQHIMELEMELQKMEAKVESFRNRLAEAEKESGVEKKKLEEYIETLENERNDLKSTVTKLQVDQQNNYIKSQTKIFALKDELHKKKDEEIERTTKLHELELKYSQAETKIANQKRQIEKNEHKEQLQIEKNKHIQQLQCEKDSSQAQVQRLQRENDSSQAHIQQLLSQIKKEKSIEGATNEPKSSQTTPTLVDPPPSCIDHQTSETESSASLSSLRPSTGTQNSLTESTGAPSRSTSRDIEQSTDSVETKTNGNTQPGEVHFKLANDNDSTLDLSKLQNKDTNQAS